MALPPILCTDFINYILKYHESPTTLIICSTREVFLQDLLASIRHTHPQEPSTSQDRDASDPIHPLLIPRIHLIAKSQSVHLSFVPTVPHLRAFLATYEPSSVSEGPSSTTSISGSYSSLLAIWGFAHLHRSTAEHSAQGLSRSLASAVEAASVGQQRLLLAEPRTLDHEDDVGSPNAPSGGLDDLWKEQVPLLSGSVRFGGEERVWAGKTIEFGSIIAKWCKFMRLDED